MNLKTKRRRRGFRGSRGSRRAWKTKVGIRKAFLPRSVSWDKTTHTSRVLLTIGDMATTTTSVAQKMQAGMQTGVQAILDRAKMPTLGESVRENDTSEILFWVIFAVSTFVTAASAVALGFLYERNERAKDAKDQAQKTSSAASTPIDAKKFLDDVENALGDNKTGEIGLGALWFVLAGSFVVWVISLAQGIRLAMMRGGESVGRTANVPATTALTRKSSAM